MSRLTSKKRYFLTALTIHLHLLQWRVMAYGGGQTGKGRVVNRGRKKKELAFAAPVEEKIVENTGLVKINEMVFTPIPGVKYKHNYTKIWQAINDKRDPAYELDLYRSLICKDLFFFVYFVMKVPIANHKFWVDRCAEVLEGSRTDTLDIWGREHGKSTIITVGDSVRDTLDRKVNFGSDESTMLFSYSNSASLKFLRQIKFLLEKSQMLKDCFPDVLWQEPSKEAPKWSEDQGLFFKRDSNFKEATFECGGLIEGMPTGGHFTRRIYDDVETYDLVQNPDQIEKLKDAFDLSQNLGTDTGIERIIGTYYHYNGLLVYLQNKKSPSTQEPIYQLRKHPSTEGGLWNGEPVYLSKARIDKLKADKKSFATQHLLDPAQTGERKLESKFLTEVDPQDIPNKLYRFMVVDWAGVRKDRDKRQDAWAIITFGVNPYRDDLGLSDLYVLDATIEPLDLPTALNTIVSMYMRAGRVLKLGVEKVGASTMDLHIVNALRAKNIYISEEQQTLAKLSPGGRSKEFRIENNLSYPFANGKIKISTSVPVAYRERLKLEMDQFPLWHDDGLDALAYGYDMIKEYRFPAFYDIAKQKESSSLWDRIQKKRMMQSRQHSWMVG
jgi:hypothetical protein